MSITLHTYEDVQLHVTCLLFDAEPIESWLLRIEKNLFADIDIDSEGHIQVSTYASLEDFEEWESPDGGGICMLWNDDPDEWYKSSSDDPNSCDNIRERGDPEEIAKLVSDKALFVWKLIHSS